LPAQIVGLVDVKISEILKMLKTSGIEKMKFPTIIKQTATGYPGYCCPEQQRLCRRRCDGLRRS
jgi:hypothetical protein